VLGTVGEVLDLADGMLLCPYHHHRIHDDRDRHTLTPDRHIEFHRWM